MRRFLTAWRPCLPGFSAVFASLAVLAAGLSACSGSPHPAGAQHRTTSATGNPSGPIRPSGPLRWQGCAGAPAPARCALLAVPLDYTHRGGRTITLALEEIPATAPAAQQLGPLLVNPGGPGASGLDLAQSVHDGLPGSLAARYDIIGFDPRGVGFSQPALHCDPSYFAGVRPPYQPTSRAAEQVQVARARAYAAACGRRSGWLLPHMTTADNARDLEAIRVALGVPQLSYLGISWGTYLGQVYATLFPGHVRRMVLDSVVNPTGVWYQDGLVQGPAVEHRINAFFAWIARHHAVYRLGTTAAQVTAQYQAALRAVAAHPVRRQARPLIGPDELTDTISQAAYADAFWPTLASALAEYRHGAKTASLVNVYRQLATPENAFAVFNAVSCSDVAAPRSWARWDSDARRLAAAAPLTTWAGTWFGAPCAFWPVQGPSAPMKIGAPGLPGILMLQGTLDGPTPYAGALAARRALPTARLVAVTGDGNHGQSLTSPPNRCVSGYLARYLATGALPSGTGLVSATCAALPPPKALGPSVS